jgi:hypothetical protein
MTLLPEYRAQLYSAAERRAGRRATRLIRSRPVVASWPVVASTAVAVAVVVVAVAALSHRHASSAPASRVPTSSVPTTSVLTGSVPGLSVPTPGPSTPRLPTSSPPAASTRQLKGMLGVLRRPQTTADRQTWVPGFFSTFASPGCRTANTPVLCALRLDRPLIREVAVPGSGYRVGLLPYTGAATIAGVAVTLRGPGVNYLAAGPWSDTTTIPPGLSVLRNRGLMLSTYISDGVNRGVLVVPDGVARVTIGPVRLLDRSVTRRLAPTAGTSAVVHDNVALFQLSGLTVQHLELRADALRQFFTQGSGKPCHMTFAIYQLAAEAHMIWLAPDGKVVNHALIEFPVYVGTHHPAPGSTVRDPNCPANG